MPHEEVAPPTLAVGAAVGVPRAREEQQVDIFLRPDEGVDQPKGRLGRHVRVHLADDQEELAPQLA
ncbi:MAG: hypothetical protein WKF86_09090, partial [Acidimicrobiales bacterium]